MVLAVVIVLLIVGSLLFHFISPWWFTPIASNWSAVDTTVNLTFIVTGIVFVLINSFLVYCVVKFRHRPDSRAHYEPENKKLEVILVGITALGVIAMLAPGLLVWAKFVDVPDDAHEVEIVGQQWRWSYRYPGPDGKFGTTDISHMSVDNPFGITPDDPNGQDDILVQETELRLPLGKPVKLLLRSLDVLHNFTVPQFRVKMDMVPGMVTYLWLTPTAVGEYEILCEELCGVAHFAMRGRVKVVEPAAYDAWLASQSSYADTVADNRTDSARGRMLYMACAGCHGQQGEGNVAMNAPRLAGLDSWYIEQQLQKFKDGLRGNHENDTYGRQMMAMVAGLSSRADMHNIAAYISGLEGAPAATTITGDTANGARLYTTCGSCHGKQAEGVWSVNAPALSGLDDWYMARQLGNFRDGIRGGHASNPSARQMAMLSTMLTDDQDVNDVIAYINSLR